MKKRTDTCRGFPGGSVVKNPASNAGEVVRSLGQEELLEKEMATYSSIRVWEIPEEPGQRRLEGSSSWGC